MSETGWPRLRGPGPAPTTSCPKPPADRYRTDRRLRIAGPSGTPPAAARLAAARAAVTAIAEHSKLPIENLISPDTVRRLSWDPPQPYDEQAVAQALAGYGARPWQIELTAGTIARAP